MSDNNDKWDTYQRATDQWGEDEQVCMAVGEIGELLALLGRHVQGRLDRDDAIDEIADAQIMLEQLQEIVGRHEVEARKREKVRRLHYKLCQHEESGDGE